MNDTDVIDYLVTIMKHTSRSKSAAVKDIDIDIDIADILGQKYLHRIDIDPNFGSYRISGGYCQ